jgi:hypothetical protein
MTDDHLARRIAEAADAWLRDPQDSEIYRRLVEATLAWRARTRPTIDGLEHAGDVPDAETVAVAVQHVMTDLRRRAAQPELE